MIRILLVDDQKSIREYLKSILHTESDLKVVGTAENGKAAIQQVAKLQPDVVIIDMEMPGLDGVTTIKIIRQRFPCTKILVLSGYDKNQYIHKSLDAGAMGYILKQASAEELRDAVRLAQKGYTQLAPGLIEKVIQKVPEPNLVTTQINTVKSTLPIALETNEFRLSTNQFDSQLSGIPLIPNHIKTEGISPLSTQPSPKQIGWRQVVTLMMMAVMLTTGIYFVRYLLRKPSPSLTYSQQVTRITDTEFTGKIKPNKVSKVMALNPGVVEAIQVKIGQEVESGEILLTLKNPEADKALTQAIEQKQIALQQQQEVLQQQQKAQQRVSELESKIAELKNNESPLARKIADADLDVALAENQADSQRRESVKRAEIIYERAQSRVRSFTRLYQDGAISKEQLEQALAEMRVAQTDLKSAQAKANTATNLEVAKREKLILQRQAFVKQQQLKRQQLEEQLQTARLDYQHLNQRLQLLRQQSSILAQLRVPKMQNSVTATTAGVVVELPVKIGEQIYTGNPLVGLANMNRLSVEVPVSTQMINVLKTGQKAVVKVGAGEATQEFSAEITTISPLPSEDMSHIVEVEFANPDNALLAGQSAAVYFLRE